MPLVNTKIKKQYTKAIKQLIKDFSRGPQTVVLVLPDLEVTCPNCLYNSLDKSSTGVFNTNFAAPVVVFTGTVNQRTINPTSFNRSRCPVCYGKGKLFAPVRQSIQAYSYWSPNAPSEDSEFRDLPAGRAPDNFVVVKTNAENYRLLYKSTAAYVNGIYVEPWRPPIIRGLAGEKTLCLGWFTAVQGKDINTKY